MTELNFIKIKQPEATLITKDLELSSDANVLLTLEITPAQYIQKLIEKKLFVDAIKFLAAGLSKRESTWWACLCARTVLTDKPSALDIKAIERAEAWVYKPTPENCQLTQPAAEATEFKTAAGWAAIAAFWSGDNISPNKEAIVPPPTGLTAKAVNGAVLLAATQVPPAEIMVYQQLFIRQGVDIACGGDGRSIKLG